MNMNNNTTIYGKTSFDVQKEILDKRNNKEAIEFYCELTINSKNNIICCSCDSDMMNSHELDGIRKFIRTELAKIVYEIQDRPKMADIKAVPRVYVGYQTIQNRDDEDDINDMMTYPQFRYTNTSDLSDLVKIIICSSTKSCDIYCIDNKSNTVIKEITSTNKLTPIQLLIMGIADDIAICNVIRNINSLRIINVPRVFDLLMNTSSAFNIKSKDESDLFEMFMEKYGQTYVYNYLPRSKQNNNMYIVVENSFGLAGTEEVFSYMTDGSNNYCKFFCDGKVYVPSTVPVTVVVNNESDFDEIVSDMLMSADEAIERLNQESLEAIKKGEEERKSEKCSEPELRGDVPAVPVSDDDNCCDGDCSDCPKCCSETTTKSKSNEEPKNSDDVLSNVIELIGKLSSEICKLHEKKK